MSKFICNECKETFDYPNSYVEGHPYGDTYVTEEFGCCPACGGSDFETAKECEVCGELIPSSLMYDLCAECEEKADATLGEFYWGLTKAEREYLDDHRCGGWLKVAMEEIDK